MENRNDPVRQGWILYSRHARAMVEFATFNLAPNARVDQCVIPNEAGVVEPGAVEAAIAAVEKEQARLAAAGRGITLVLESLLGHRHVPRL